MGDEMKKTLKISLCIFLLIFSWLFIGILFLRNLSFTAYNIRPVKECSKFLEKTYGKEFKRTREPVAYYGKNGYHVWKIKYVDDAGMEFYEYYEHPYDSSEDGFYPFFIGDERGVRDWYWQKELQRVYGETFNLEQYQVSEELGIMKYEFEIRDENDISTTANIIAVTLKYTFDNVETISENVVGYSIIYDGRSICKIYPNNPDMERLLELCYQDEEDIYQYIYDEIYKRYQKRIEKEK